MGSGVLGKKRRNITQRRRGRREERSKTTLDNPREIPHCAARRATKRRERINRAAPFGMTGLGCSGIPKKKPQGSLRKSDPRARHLLRAWGNLRSTTPSVQQHRPLDNNVRSTTTSVQQYRPLSNTVRSTTGHFCMRSFPLGRRFCTCVNAGQKRTLCVCLWAFLVA